MARGATWGTDSDQTLILLERPLISHVRTSILLWSTASGAILGLFVDATLVGVTVLASAMIPSLGTRLQHRWVTMSSIVLLALIPLVLSWLGFLEGRLKAV